MNKNAPQGWTISNIDKTCLVLDSKRIPINSEERSARKGQYPYYGANGIQGYIDDYIFEGEHFLLAEDGGNFDQWESRPISYLVSGKFWVNNHAHILKGKAGNETKFLHYSLVHKNITKHINGGTRAKLNQSDMRDIELALPPLAEQKKIAVILSSVDDVIESTQAKIHKLKDLKTGMMQELLTNGIGHTGFKESSFGLIPASWDVVHLEDIFTIKHGYPFEGEYFTSTPQKYILLTPGNFHRDGHLYFGDKTKYFSGPVPQDYILKNGDLLVVMTDLTKEMTILGNTIELNSTTEVLHNQRIGKISIIAEQRILSEFACLVFNSEIVKRHVRDTATGTTVRHTSPSRILEPTIALPPLEEQLKIVRALSSINSRLILEKEKSQKYSEIKKSLMQDLLTGKVRVKVN